MMQHIVERLKEQRLRLERNKQQPTELHTPLPDQADLSPTDQSMLTLRLRTTSQYNLVELQKAIDLAG